MATIGIGGNDLAGKRIVLVEDDEVSLYAVSSLLNSAGCEAVPYADYRGALNEVESDRPIDLLITDIKLPSGTPHGIALAQMARERRRSLPLLFITAFEEFAHLIDTGLGEVILKPIDAEAFFASVRAACHSKRADGRPDAVAAAG